MGSQPIKYLHSAERFRAFPVNYQAPPEVSFSGLAA
jgi:hypothetical protein